MTASFFVLIAMSFLSFLFALIFYRKRTAINKLNGLPPTVFDRTFNVFDPFVRRTQRVLSSIVPMLFLAVFGSLIIGFVVAGKIFELGLLMSFAILTWCLALMMVDEAIDINRNAGVFVEAAQDDLGFAKGDLLAVSMVREALPKLIAYYVVLGIVFLVSLVALPTLVQFGIIALAGIATAGTEAALSISTVAAYFAPLSVVFAAFLVLVVTGRLKSKIFSFPPSGSLNTLGKTYDIMKSFVAWVSHHEGIAFRPIPEPDETPESEQKKT
jgi:hypothetical protein